MASVALRRYVEGLGRWTPDEHVVLGKAGSGAAAGIHGVPDRPEPRPGEREPGVARYSASSMFTIASDALDGIQVARPTSDPLGIGAAEQYRAPQRPIGDK